MIWTILLISAGVIVVLAFVLDWRSTTRLKKHLAAGGTTSEAPDPAVNATTNYSIIEAQANGTRNQSAGGGFF